MTLDELLREVAEQIIISHTEDIEYLSIREMSYDSLDMDTMTQDEQKEIWHKLDKLIRSAKVTITFPEDDIATKEEG